MIRVFAKAALSVLLAANVSADDGAPASLMEDGHWKRVRSLAQARYQSNPNDAYANYLLGRVKFEYGDLDAAQPLAEKAVALDGNKADYHFLLSAVYGRKAEQANIFSQFGLARKFKAEAEKSIELDPNHIEARHALIQFHLQAPGIVGGDKKKAYTYAEEVLRINAARGYLEKANIARREKQLDQLEPLYLKAVQADPKSYAARMALANFYNSDAQKKYDLGEQHAREAVKLEPGRAGGYATLAALYAYQKRWKDLDAILAQAENNIADNLNPFYQAGRVLVDNSSDLARAERYFRRYLAQEPEPNHPSLGAAHWRLGQALEKQGRTAEALREYETAVQMDPKLEQAKKDLKRLGKR